MPFLADLNRHRLSTIMRADRILVVMNGEIVESGTHDELIYAKGKYLSLWSKQVYVKPADEPAGFQSPKKRDAEIINDLTTSRQKAELAKIMKTTANDEPATHGGSNDKSANHSELGRTGAELTMSTKSKGGPVGTHKREVCDWSQ